MRIAPLVLIAALGSVTLASPVAAQAKRAVPSVVPARISDAEISEDGAVTIKFSDGRSVQMPRGKGQAGREQLQVATNRNAVGWLEVDAPIGSNSVPTTLTVYRVGKPLKHFGDGLMLLDWSFTDDDKRIRFSSSQAHGTGANWLTMEVHDIETGRLLERWLEQDETADPRVPLASITGRVTDGKGAPLADAIVSIRSHSGLEPFALTISGEGGRFTLQGVEPGEHELRFEHPRFGGRVVKITVGASEEVIDAGVVTLEKSSPVR